MQLTVTTLGGLLLAAFAAHLFEGVHGFLPLALVRTNEVSKRLHLGLSITENTECQEAMESSFSTSITTEESPVARAVEIFGIISGEILCPLVVSLLKNGFPSDWETFWSQGGKITNA